eukprot:TRINITY_DN11960_c0_g1_i1.p1 TRINITY_DN11960_c0_g1~~TRINITY_DN11960_c0_g1_i1.p1  ORF type:complete len:173 (+),score=10.53 TRINITY_DN11960_c0_g1_i1:25-543(+)
MCIRDRYIGCALESFGQNRKQIAEKNGFTTIIQAMNNHPQIPLIQQNTCRAIWSLADFQNETIIAQQGGIEAIIKAMSSSSHFGYSTLCMRCSMGSRCRYSKSKTEKCGIEAIIQPMNNHPLVLDIQHCVRILLQTLKIKIRLHKTVELKLLSKNSAIQQYACCALHSIAVK